MDEMTTTRTIETITAEIVALKADAGKAIIGIGERLIEAKEQLGHGEWLPWLTEKVDFSERTAQNFMRLAREWRNPQTLADLGASKALTLLALPEPEREEFITAHDVPNMSTRELESAIRERDEAKTLAEAMKTRAEAAEAAQAATHRVEVDLREKLKALQNEPKEVYRDEAAIKAAADEAKKAAEAEAAKKISDLEKKLAKAEKSAKDAAAESAAAGGAELEAAKKAEADAKAEAEALRLQLEEAKEARKKDAVAGDADLAMAQEYAAQIVASANKLRGLLLKAQNAGDEAKAGIVRKAILTLAEKLQEVAK